MTEHCRISHSTELSAPLFLVPVNTSGIETGMSTAFLTSLFSSETRMALSQSVHVPPRTRDTLAAGWPGEAQGGIGSRIVLTF